MAESTENAVAEISPLNQDWEDFDLEHLSLDELEERFELSLTAAPILMQGEGEGEGDCRCNGCPNLRACGIYCDDD